MQDASAIDGPAIQVIQQHAPVRAPAEKATEVVSTHVLVEQEKVEQLRELSRRTRIAQSEYLREAVDDLLEKYEKKASP